VASSPRRLSAPDVEARLRARFGDDILEVADQHAHAAVRVKPEVYREVCRFPRDEPIAPTVSDLFPTSDWHERETAEMFGIRFEGHPQPVKLLLSEPFEGHPLRKDFPLMTREAKPWPGAVEGEEEEEE
jgi:NADH:ubiquinone oxidoreductase subunit C